MKRLFRYGILVAAAACLSACGSRQDISLARTSDAEPAIFPDYKGVTVPANIAPLNFSYEGDGECALLVEGQGSKLCVKGMDGLFDLPAGDWRRMLASCKGDSLKLTIALRQGQEWVGTAPFYIHVAEEEIDPYLSYRLIPPGYQAWNRMGIYQRDLESYRQTPIYENKLTNGNCVNCHSYCNRSPDKMLFHARAEFGGTVMILDDVPEKLNTKTDATISALVYPYWHPSGRYVAFSTNATNQNFFSHDPNRIEVYDSASDVVVYDVQHHCIAFSPLTKSDNAFETFPTFSPDGRYLYFCSAQAVSPMPERYREVKYSICRIDFNADDMTFGDRVDTLFSAPATGKSASFPRISPDGRYLAFTLHEYGNFSIWHKDADLYMIDLETRQTYPLAAANSDDVDSYHSWSGNSRWMVFSSRRTDLLYTRPYIAYIDKDGQAHKPFLLPQKNPRQYYERLMYSYNIPELMARKATVSAHRIASTLRTSKGTDVTVK